MEDIKRKINKDLASYSICLSEEDLDYLIERFGVKDINQVDDDFIQIILSLVQTETPAKNEEHHQNLPKFSEKIEQLKSAVALKVETEAAKIAALYQEAPNQVRDLVLKDLSENNPNKPRTFSELRNIVDFSVVFQEDNLKSSVMVYRMIHGLFLLSFLLIVSSFILGLLENVEVNYTNSSQTAQTIQNQCPTSEQKQR